MLSLLLFKLNFLQEFFKFNYNILNEGLLVDFIQKFFFIRISKRLIFDTFFLLNEKLNFELIVFYFIDLIVWTKNYYWIQPSYSIYFMLQTLFSTILFLLFFLIF